jgi:predicted acetyltransferase
LSPVDSNHRAVSRDVDVDVELNELSARFVSGLTRPDPCVDASAGILAAMREWFGRFRSPRFAYLDPGPMRDGELQLIEPAARWMDAMLLASGDPDMGEGAGVGWSDRPALAAWLAKRPRGREPLNDATRVPAYTFWMLRHHDRGSEIAGTVSLRVGHSRDIVQFFGHIGYSVLPQSRGRRFAERSTRLLFPLARRDAGERGRSAAGQPALSRRRTKKVSLSD